MTQDSTSEINHILNPYMVPPFLSLSKENDIFPFSGQPRKTIGAVSIMWILSTIDQCGTQETQMPLPSVC